MISRIFFWLFPLLLLLCQTAEGQGIILRDLNAESKISLSPTPWKINAQVTNLQQAQLRNQQAIEQAQRQGYLQIELVESTFANDTLFNYWRLGAKTQVAQIQLNQPELIAPLTSKTNSIPFEQLEQQLLTWNQQLQELGYPLAQSELRNFRLSNDTLYAQLWCDLKQARTIDRLVFQGYDKFSKNHKKYLQRKFVGKSMSPSVLSQLQNELNAFRFIQTTRPTETLFTTDSTHLYIYVEKKQANRFDGIIGFSNDETNSKVIFSGYLDAELHNLIHRGEQLRIEWKSNGEEQRTFNGQIELPYLFSLPLALQAELNIFQQDSTFQNASTSFGLGYYINPSWRTYLARKTTSSSDVQNANSGAMQDFDAQFWNWKNSFELSQTEFPIYGPRLRIETQLGVGKREGKFSMQDQWVGQTRWEALFPINNRHAVFLSNGLYWLHSEDYLTNELERIGGAKTIRGFNENQFHTNAYAWLQTEYRYLLSPSLYVHSIMDFGYYQDKTIDLEAKLWSVGLGAGLQTPMGVLSLMYANGTQDEQPFKFSNSLFHFTLRTSF